MTNEEIAKMLVEATATAHLAVTQVYGAARAGDMVGTQVALAAFRQTVEVLAKVAPVAAERICAERSGGGRVLS